MLVTLCFVWDCRLIFQAAHKLKTYKKRVYLSPDLTNDEREKEHKILTKRHELINLKILNCTDVGKKLV